MISKHPKKSNKQTSRKITEKRKVQRIKNQAATTAKTLAYRSLSEDGLMHVTDDIYSYTYHLGTVNYVTATTEERQAILSRYNDALNTLSDSEHFQLTIRVSEVSKEEFMNEMATPDASDGHDDLRHDLNTLIEKNYDRGMSNFKQEHYISLSTHGDSRTQAISKLENIATLFRSNLKRIRVDFDALSGDERLALIHSMTRPGVPLFLGFKDIQQSLLTDKDLLAPQSLIFKKNRFELEGQHKMTLFLRNYPYALSDNLFKNLTEAGIPLVITLHASPYSISETNRRLRELSTVVDADIANQQIKLAEQHLSPDLIGRKTKENKVDLDEQIEFVRETGDKQFSAIILVEIEAETDEQLKERQNLIQGIGATFGAVFVPLDYLQEEAFNSTLPFGMNFTDVEEIFQRDLLTANVSVNSPFTTVDLHHRNGKYYGVNLLNQNVIALNRRDRRAMKNSGGLVLGITGAGKSVATKYEIASTFLRDNTAEIIVLDPEDEYRLLAKDLGGQIVNISPRSSNTINLLELPDPRFLTSDDDAVALKSNFLLSLFSSLLPLSSTQESLIDAVTLETYDTVKAPTLLDWDKKLRERQDDPDALALAKALDKYIHGSLDLFAHKTTVDLSNRFIVFNTKNIQHKFKAFALMVLMDKIWNRVVENRAKGITTWFYADEIHTLLSPNQPKEVREVFASLWARIRKYGGNPTGISQSAETILATDEGTTIFFNSAFMVLLQQQAEVRDVLVDSLRLTPEQAQYLDTPGVGEGLIVAGSTVVPFGNFISKNTKLFELLNTDAETYQQQQLDQISTSS